MLSFEFCKAFQSNIFYTTPPVAILDQYQRQRSNVKIIQRKKLISTFAINFCGLLVEIGATSSMNECQMKKSQKILLKITINKLIGILFQCCIYIYVLIMKYGTIKIYLSCSLAYFYSGSRYYFVFCIKNKTS